MISSNQLYEANLEEEDVGNNKNEKQVLKTS